MMPVFIKKSVVGLLCLIIAFSAPINAKPVKKASTFCCCCCKHTPGVECCCKNKHSQKNNKNNGTCICTGPVSESESPIEPSCSNGNTIPLKFYQIVYQIFATADIFKQISLSSDHHSPPCGQFSLHSIPLRI